MKNNSNEYTQLTIDNLTRTPVFEIVETAEEEEEEPDFCRNYCGSRNMMNCCTCKNYNRFSSIGGEL